jgi:hypothetical protein
MGATMKKVKHIIDKGSAVSDKLYIYFEGFFNNHDIRTQVFLKGADEKKAKAFLEKARTVVLTLQKEFIPLSPIATRSQRTCVKSWSK